MHKWEGSSCSTASSAYISACFQHVAMCQDVCKSITGGTDDAWDGAWGRILKRSLSHVTVSQGGPGAASEDMTLRAGIMLHEHCSNSHCNNPSFETLATCSEQPGPQEWLLQFTAKSGLESLILTDHLPQTLSSTQ
jgi:hypothetical protein